jgi:hypothetical protein
MSVVDLLSTGLLLAGLVLLAAGAELLVRGASRLATAAGISPLAIGLTVVAFGTTAPGVAVSVQAGAEARAAGTADSPVPGGRAKVDSACATAIISGSRDGKLRASEPPWRNRYTHQVEDLCSQGRAGSSPVGGTTEHSSDLRRWRRSLFRANSSVGHERPVYTRKVAGSSPASPTSDFGLALRVGPFAFLAATPKPAARQPS